MIIDNLNLNLLRVFESVYRTNSMTTASHELFMTQSAVSQNIKNLESILDIKLFDRIKHKLVPTPKADQLYDGCTNNLRGIENTLAHITGIEKELSGTIKIGLPLEYGNNTIIPLLSEWGRENTKLTFKIIYGHASDLNDHLCRGELDFAFVDNYSFDKQIKIKNVINETVILCCSKDYAKTHSPIIENRKWFEKIDYIAYLENAPILKSWFKYHFNFSHFNPNVRASLMNVRGISKMIVNHLGVGVLPLYVVHQMEELGHKIYKFKGSSKTFTNSISIAYLDGRSFGPAVIKTIDFFTNALLNK